ncbi:hypothetical protein R3P38DRAFT_2981776 [Favolaschia claudopus]|uniref:Pheromone receptor n=1 Tax=Favolaschia claudopus TaxID=2862362 RepID=A0AAW0AXF9_9AGAR
MIAMRLIAMCFDLTFLFHRLRARLLNCSPPAFRAMNPDMQGYLVRLSNFITHLGVAILIAGSNSNPRKHYSNLFAQSTFILVGVFISIHRNQIDISDAEFALHLTRSPTCIYLVLLVIPRLFMKSFLPFARHATQNIRFWSNGTAWKELWIALTTPGVVDSFCGAFGVLSCLALNISVQLNSIGNFYSPVSCPANGCVEPVSYTFAQRITVWFSLVVISLVLYECVLERHKALRWKLMRDLAARKPSIRKTFYWKRGVCGICATWYIAATLHPWIPFLYVSVLFYDWAKNLNLWTIEPKFQLTYGQVLAICPAIPVALQCFALAFHHRSSILIIPARLFSDIIWIITGKGQAWRRAEDIELNDVWQSFPADVLVVVEPDLPIHLRNLSGFQSETSNARRRRHRKTLKTTDAAPTSALNASVSHLPEMDLGEVNLMSIPDVR